MLDRLSRIDTLDTKRKRGLGACVDALADSLGVQPRIIKNTDGVRKLEFPLSYNDTSGVVTLRVVGHEVGGSELTVEFIEAEPAGSGLGAYAYTALESVARELGYTRILADTALTEGAGFWKRMGFSPVGPANDYIKNL